MQVLSSCANYSSSSSFSFSSSSSKIFDYEDEDDDEDDWVAACPRCEISGSGGLGAHEQIIDRSAGNFLTYEFLALSNLRQAGIEFMAKHRGGGWLTWAVIILLVAGMAGGGVWYYKHAHNDGPTYQTVTVTRGELIQLVTATGTLNPVTNVQVGCQVSGRISKIDVDFNSRVKAGEVIAEIDPSTYQAAVAQAAADLANAKANLELQQVETRRDSNLFTNQLISESDYDTAVATLHEAQATVQIKEAALTNAVENLGYCKICSPVDGVVISRAVDVGQTVAASFNTPTLFQIANDLAQMQIDANVDEADIGSVQDGQSVDFTVDAYPNRTFHGVVSQVRNAPTTVNNVVTYDGVISVNNGDLKLKPGMTATVSIITAEHTNVLEIPNSALRFQPPETAMNDAGGGPSLAGNRTGGGGRAAGGQGEQAVVRTVYLLSNDGRDPKFQPVQITLGITDNIYTEVLSGLKEGDAVVTGLKIPGLTSGPEVNNPFSPRRRF